MKPIRILIVDDHAMVREGLGLALKLQPDFEIVGQARNGTEGLALTEQFQPDVILLDLNMPDLDGITVTQQVRSISPLAQVLILSGLNEDKQVFAAIQAGVDGYIVKDATTTELIQAIRQVASGHSYFHPLITQALIRYTRASAASPPAKTTLTSRELDVLRLMVTSATNRAIAEELHVSEETVRTHVKGILRKLNQPNRTQAVLEAVRRGLIALE